MFPHGLFPKLLEMWIPDCVHRALPFRGKGLHAHCFGLVERKCEHCLALYTARTRDGILISGPKVQTLEQTLRRAVKTFTFIDI